jgi:chromosome segregation ATPase
VSNRAALMIEGLVALLLVITIVYCALLNKRLRRLKADEMSLKATISELITATEIAERAIGGLKVTVRECDQDLGERLRAAEQFSAEIARQIEAGQDVLGRLTRIAIEARPLRGSELPDPKSMLVAAQAFAERARTRVSGYAA